MSTNHLTNMRIKIITIGVKSNIPIRVGTYFLTNIYIGSIISLNHFGRKFTQRIKSQESITSKNMRYQSISIKTTIVNTSVVSIGYFEELIWLYPFSAAFSCAFFLLLPSPFQTHFSARNTQTIKFLLWSGPSSSRTW